MKFIISLFALFPLFIFAQGTLLNGRVFNKLNNNSVEFAKVTVLSVSNGALTDEEGRFEIKDLAPGVYSFRASAAGFKDFYINKSNRNNTSSRGNKKKTITDIDGDDDDEDMELPIGFNPMLSEQPLSTDTTADGINLYWAPEPLNKRFGNSNP